MESGIQRRGHRRRGIEGLGCPSGSPQVGGGGEDGRAGKTSDTEQMRVAGGDEIDAGGGAAREDMVIRRIGRHHTRAERFGFHQRREGVGPCVCTKTSWSPVPSQKLVEAYPGCSPAWTDLACLARLVRRPRPTWLRGEGGVRRTHPDGRRGMPRHARGQPGGCPSRIYYFRCRGIDRSERMYMVQLARPANPGSSEKHFRFVHMYGLTLEGSTRT
jgi:hypothetical protein